MTTRVELLESIAKTIADYREGEIPKPTPEHVERWVNQFEEEVQIPLLSELSHVLEKTYFNKNRVIEFLHTLVDEKKLAGASPCDFWKSVNFLNIQQKGHSQEEMLEVFSEILQGQCGLRVKDCRSDEGPYIYLDDALFSGFRVGDDLDKWLKGVAPDNATVHIVMIAIYAYGEWKTKQRLERKAKELKKNIEFHFWREITFENNPKRSSISEVFWPATLPNDKYLKAYMAENHKFPFDNPREVGGKGEHDIFSSEEGRQLIERELLLAGVKIRALSQKPSMRPLGFGPFGLGFGATVVTFRNCPNNCPLALWWGDSDADESSPLSNWYPLFPRKTYSEGTDLGGILFE